MAQPCASLTAYLPGAEYLGAKRRRGKEKGRGFGGATQRREKKEEEEEKKKKKKNMSRGGRTR